MGKGLLIIVLGSMMTLTLVSLTFVKSSSSGLDNSMDHYEDLQARNIGNSMINMLLTRLADDMRYRLIDSEEKSYLGGETWILL